MKTTVFIDPMVMDAVRDGTGLALALYFTMQITSRARTNSVITVMITSVKVLNQVMSSVTPDTDS